MAASPMSEMIMVMADGGWAYDALEHGFVKGDLWVTWGQAVAALTAAEAGEEWILNDGEPPGGVPANEA